MSRLVASLAILLLAVPCTFAADPSVEKSEAVNGWINWERLVVKAIGYGVLPGDVENEEQAKLLARSAAITNARRSLASVIEGVRVSDEVYLKNFIAESDEIRERVPGFVRRAQIVSEKQLHDRSFEVIVQAHLTDKGGLMSILSSRLLPNDTEHRSDNGKFTGLIIDARGLGVKPCMSPKIYDDEGKEVYSAAQASTECAVEIGIAAYAQDMKRALKHPRAGKDPLVVKAVKRRSESATEIVVSTADAERIREADCSGGILSRCRVSILIGPIN